MCVSLTLCFFVLKIDICVDVLFVFEVSFDVCLVVDVLPLLFFI